MCAGSGGEQWLLGVLQYLVMLWKDDGGRPAVQQL